MLGLVESNNSFKLQNVTVRAAALQNETDRIILSVSNYSSVPLSLNKLRVRVLCDVLSNCMSVLWIYFCVLSDTSRYLCLTKYFLIRVLLASASCLIATTQT
jgi:hypothetical protein